MWKKIKSAFKWIADHTGISWILRKVSSGWKWLFGGKKDNDNQENVPKQPDNGKSNSMNGPEKEEEPEIPYVPQVHTNATCYFEVQNGELLFTITDGVYQFLEKKCKSKGIEGNVTRKESHLFVQSEGENFLITVSDDLQQNRNDGRRSLSLVSMRNQNAGEQNTLSDQQKMIGRLGLCGGTSTTAVERISDHPFDKKNAGILSTSFIQTVQLTPTASSDGNKANQPIPPVIPATSNQLNTPQLDSNNEPSQKDNKPKTPVDDTSVKPTPPLGTQPSNPKDQVNGQLQDGLTNGGTTPNQLKITGNSLTFELTEEGAFEECKTHKNPHNEDEVLVYITCNGSEYRITGVPSNNENKVNVNSIGKVENGEVGAVFFPDNNMAEVKKLLNVSDEASISVTHFSHESEVDSAARECVNNLVVNVANGNVPETNCTYTSTTDQFPSSNYLVK